MSEHPNAATLRRLFAALEERDVTTVTALIAEDAGWRFPGSRGQLAGEHRGHAEIMAFLAKVMALTGGTFHLEIEDVAASDEHAIVLFTGHGERNGKQLNNPTCLQVRMVGGRAVEFQEFLWGPRPRRGILGLTPNPPKALRRYAGRAGDLLTPCSAATVD